MMAGRNGFSLVSFHDLEYGWRRKERREPMPIQMVEFESAQGTLRGALHALKGAAPGPAVLCCRGFTGHRNESHGLLVKASRAFEARWIA